jgi:DNA-binding NarL/FixJ family response regulator
MTPCWVQKFDHVSEEKPIEQAVALDASTADFVPVTAPPNDYFNIQVDTKKVLSPGVASRVLGRMRAPAEEALSAREIEVLGAVARGLPNREVARDLHSARPQSKRISYTCLPSSAWTTGPRP